MARSRQSIRLLAAGAAVVTAVLVSACSVTNQITSQLDYDPSDGVGVEFGDISAENLLLIAAAAGEPGALQGALTNHGDATAVVQVATSEDTTEIRLSAGQTVLLGGSDGKEILLTTPDAPGATTDLTLATGSAGRQTLSVPVLDGGLPEYTDLVPAPAPSAEPGDGETASTDA